MDMLNLPGFSSSSYLLIDGGSTKMDCILSDAEGHISRFEECGINPLLCDNITLHQAIKKIKDAITPFDAETPHIYYFGAGCGSEIGRTKLNDAFSSIFDTEQIYVGTDIELAARLMIGNKQGVAAILGTGANAVLYNDGRYESKVPSLGFILGDEGSGSSMGKEFLARYLRSTLPDSIAELIASTSEYCNRNTILDGVYRSTHPSQYLAGVVKCVFENKQNQSCQEYFTKEIALPLIQLFFEHQLAPYLHSTNNLYICGSIGWLFEKIIKEIGQKRGWNVKMVIKSPLDLLGN